MKFLFIQVQDDSGEIDVIQWLEEGSNQPEYPEGTPVKVVGSIRSQQDKKHIMAFKIGSVANQAEYDAHILEVVYTKLKLRQMQQKLNGQIGMSDGSLSQSMMGGGLGIQGKYTAKERIIYGEKDKMLNVGLFPQTF